MKKRGVAKRGSADVRRVRRLGETVRLGQGAQLPRPMGP